MYTITSKEDLVYFMQTGAIKLGTNDSGFIFNLNSLIARRENITSNQVVLFDTLIKKYARQLIKQGYASADLLKLPWLSSVIPSEPKYTEAYVSIAENKIVFRAPFNKKFIKALASTRHHPFKWDKERRVHEAVYDTESLKCLVELVSSCFPTINYCPIVTSLLEDVNQYHSTYWSPTLIKLGNRYIIASTNQHLDKALQDVELTDDPVCLSLLAAHGVSIDPSVTRNNPLLEFAGSFSPVVDFKDVDIVVEYLTKINCDSVFLAGQNGMASHYRRTLVNKIQSAGIKMDDKSHMIWDASLSSCSNPVAINLTSTITYIPAKFKKFIIMKNSLPVGVR